MSTDENMTPAKDDWIEKRPKLKRIKKKKSKFDLNASTNSKLFKSFQSRMNISAANSSVVKASLRANNKALAQSLEKVRQDLRISYEINNDLKKENQDLHLRLVNLERVAGLKDDSLEKEVQRRIEDKTKQLKQILSSVSVHLLDAGSGLQDALDKCIDPTRLSVASSARNSSLGASDDAYSPLGSGAPSSIYYNPTTFSRVKSTGPAPVVDSEDPPEILSQQQMQEMTMILEQSVLPEEKSGEALEELPAVTEDTPAILEAVDDVQTIEETLPKPSRKSKEQPKDEEPKSKIKKKSKLAIDSPKPDRRGTFVIPAPVQPAPIPDDNTSSRRETFVLKKAPQDTNVSKRSKRETFVVASPGIPAETLKDDSSVFKMPLPVSTNTELPMDEDATVYLNTDMELTGVIAVDQTLLAGEPKKSVESEKEKERPSRIGKSSSLTVISSKDKSDVTSSKTDVKASKSDSDIRDESGGKSAVTLQLRKPGKIVFSAARKDWDGSRKVLPSKLPSRPRTKSKKEIKELKESIKSDRSEPKNIFDFHDKTPVHLTEKSRIVPCENDFPDSQPQTAARPADKGEVPETKCDSVSVTYNMPLKGSPDEKKGQRRGRSQSRSRSKTRKVESDVEDSDKDEKKVQRRGRSQSRGRSKTRKTESDVEDTESGDSKPSSGRKSGQGRSKSRQRLKKEEADVDVLKQSETRATRKSCADLTDEDDEIIIDRKSRSRSKKKKQPSTDDEEPKSKSKEKAVPRKSNGTSHDEAVSDEDFQTTHKSTRKSARGKSLKLKKGQVDNSSSDDQAKQESAGLDLDWQEDNVIADDPDVTVNLQPVCSRDFISRIRSTSNAGLVTESDKPASPELKSKTPRSDTDDEGESCHTRTRDRKTLKLASATDDEMEEDDNRGNMTEVVPATDIEDHSDEEQKQGKDDPRSKVKRKSVKESKVVMDTESKVSQPNLEIDVSSKSKSKGKVEDGKKSAIASGTSGRINPAPLKVSPEATRGRSRTLKKVERDRSQSRKRVNVLDILNAFKEADDPDHSLRLNVTGKNDSVVIAEVIRTAVTGGSNISPCVVEEKEEEFEKLCQVFEDTTEVYNLPLKGSPEETKTKARARSQSRGRSRSKKRTVNFESDDSDGEYKPKKSTKKKDKESDDSDEEYMPRKTTKRTKNREKTVEKNKEETNKDIDGRRKEETKKETGKKEKREASREKEDRSKDEDTNVQQGMTNVRDRKGNKEESTTYSLPLKGSPETTKKTSDRSRSKSRPRVGERGRSQSRKRDASKISTEEKSKEEVDRNEEQETKLQQTKTNDNEKETDKEESSTYSLPLKGSPVGTKKISNRSRSKSRQGRGGDRGRSQSRKREQQDSLSAEADVQNSPKKGRETLIEQSGETVMPSKPKSVKKTKQKTNSKLVKDEEERIDNENSETGKENMDEETESVGLAEATPKDTAKRPAKEDSESKASKMKKSTGKKSEKKKEVSESKTQQEKLKESFNELKRKLSLMPRASERMSMTLAEKENEEASNKRKRESGDEDGVEVEKRSRRAAAGAISYKEPSSIAKLRRGDPGTSNFFISSAPLKIFKSPIKRDRTSQSNAVLDNISNTAPISDK